MPPLERLNGRKTKVFVTDYHQVDPADYIREDLLDKKGFDADRWINAHGPEEMEDGNWVYIDSEDVYADSWTEAKDRDLEDQYDDVLDCEGPVKVCGFDMWPSDILRDCDPIAYRCGFNDYIDALVKDGELFEA